MMFLAYLKKNANKIGPTSLFPKLDYKVLMPQEKMHIYIYIIQL